MEGLDIENTEFRDIYGFSKATISGIHWNCIPKVVRDHFQVIYLLKNKLIICRINQISHCSVKHVLQRQKMLQILQ